MAQKLATERVLDHVAYIERHFASLVDGIELVYANIWDQLVERGVISSTDTRYIKETNKANRDQVRALLYLLQQRPITDFYTFQNILQNSLEEPPRKRKAESPRPEFKRNISLCSDRFTVLNEHAEQLENYIQVAGSELLQFLVQKNVISQENSSYIQKPQENYQQVKRLMQIILRSDDMKFELFCDCLWESKQENVVKTFLYTSEDFNRALIKIKDHIKTEFADIHMYNADGEAKPVPLDTIYVNVTWHRIADEGTKEIPLDSYMDIFQKMQDHQETRTVLSGIAGSGKTTFVKHIAAEWNKACTDCTGSPLTHYQLFAPIILRLVQEDMTFIDIIRLQIPRLCYLEAYAVVKSLELLKGHALLVLDGYDELTFHNVIDPIIKKMEYSDVNVVVTTRPHGVTLVRRLGGNSIQQLVYLHGFSEKQIEKYAELFFYEIKEGDEKKDKLLDNLKTGPPFLMQMAKVPIQLELICIVWNVKKKLGRRTVDLYENFVECLEFHMSMKDSKEMDYHRIRMDIGKLANKWTPNRTLEKIFIYKEVERMFTSNFENIIKFGCLVKYHPATILEKSYWSFSHLTLQEYFLALYIGNSSPDEVQKFTDVCSSVARLEQLEMVLKFLCGINPFAANQVLEPVIKITTDKSECTRLLILLQNLVMEYSQSRSVALPLPKYVSIKTIKQRASPLVDRGTSTIEVNIDPDVWFVLSLSDSREENKNMKHLALEAPALNYLGEHPELIQCSYVETVEVNVNGLHDTDTLSKLLKSSWYIESLSVVGIKVIYQKKHLSECLPKTLKTIKLSGENVIKIATSCIEASQKVDKLELDERGIIEDKCMENFCKTVNRKGCVDKLHLTVPTLSKDLVTLQSSVNVSLSVSSLNYEILEPFVTDVEQASTRMNIYELHIKTMQLETKEKGTLFGRLLICLNHVNSLLIGQVHIFEAGELDFEATISIIQLNNVRLSLRSLSIMRLNMQGKGALLGKFVCLCPNLNVLDLTDSGLTKTDLQHFADILPDNTNISRLRLSEFFGQEGGAEAVGQLLKHTSKLEYLDLDGCLVAVPQLLHCISRESLSHLRILDLSCNKDQNFTVSRYLSFMPKLEALSLAECGCTSIDDLCRLLDNLPTTLRHLIVRGNAFGTAVVEVTNYKTQLSQLERLNISDSGQIDEMEAIREELRDVNPELRVYHDDHEHFCDMYLYSDSLM